MIRVTIPAGILRNTFVDRNANERYLAALGVLEIDCLECEGDGDWTKFVRGNRELSKALTGFEDPPARALLCIDCKGTGKVYVSA